MNDMSSTIIAKSDQINAADLVGISRTVTVREVKIKPGDDQPVSILIEGDNKAFRPCKGVRRLLVRVWGADANKYVGQSMTLFCDPKVTWAGKEEGGIRVSHMTGLSEDIVENMRISRAATKPYKIRPLKVEQRDDAVANWVSDFIAAVKDAADIAALDALLAGKGKRYTDLETKRPELFAECEAAISEARTAMAIDHREGRTDEQHGDQFDGVEQE